MEIMDFLTMLSNGEEKEEGGIKEPTSKIPLIQGKKYYLNGNSGHFCHYHSTTSGRISRNELINYPHIFIGEIMIETGKRNIFYCENFAAYAMFTIGEIDYVKGRYWE